MSVARPVPKDAGDAESKRIPVLIEMTPYSQANPLGPNAFFIEHGYIYVVARPCGAMIGEKSAAGPYFKKFYDGVLAGGPEAYSGYWKDRLPLSWANKIADNHIPVLLWGGWQDLNETGAEHAYTALQNAMAGQPFYAPLSPSTQDNGI